MKVLGHLSVSKRINTNHPWFHLAIFGLSFQMYFDGIISKREAKKMLGRTKKLNSKMKSWHHFSLIRLRWMTIVKCLFSYLSSPHVLTQPLMGADHVTIVTTLSHFCHEARIVRDTRDTCQCIFSPSGWTRDQQVSQHRNIDFFDLNKSRHCHMIVSHIKYNLSWQESSYFCRELWWWWRQLGRVFAHRAHVSFHWSRVTELQRDATSAEREGWFRWEQTEDHIFTKPSRGTGCQNCEDRG